MNHWFTNTKQIQSLGLIVLILFSSCKTNDNSLEGYFKGTFTNLSSNTVKIDSIFYANPMDVVLLDTLLVFYDKFTDNNETNYFTLLDIKNRKLIRRFGRDGKGPNEIMYPTSIDIDKKDSSFVMFFPATNNIMKYSLADLIRKPAGPIVHQGTRFEKSSQKVGYTTVAKLQGVDQYLGPGLFEKGKYAISNFDGKMDSIIGEYVKSQDQKRMSNIQLAMGYQGDVNSHPFLPKCAYFCVSCDLIEVIDCSVGKSYPIKRFQSYYPDFKAQPSSVAHNATSPLGFIGSYVTARYIYGLYSGKAFAEYGNMFAKSNKLYVFDWDLTPIRAYELDHQIQCIAVSDDDQELYSTAIVNDEMELVKWSLKH